MKSSKPTSTALARVLVLPLTAGLLAGCDYASKLPDAPSTLGYELQSQKPPSVTAPIQEPVGPPPPPALVASLPEPGQNLNTQVLQVSPGGFEVPREALALPPTQTLPVPGAGAVAQNNLARLSTVGQPASQDSGAYTPPPIDFGTAQVPQVGVAIESDTQFSEYTPIPFDETSQQISVASIQPEQTYEAYQPPALETVPYEPPAFESQPSTVLYSAPPLAAPLTYGSSVGDGNTVDTTPIVQTPIVQTPSVRAPIVQTPSPAPSAPASPISVLHARLDNGAVVNVHPVVGAPGATSGMLAQTIAAELGASVDKSALAFAPAVFDLRASASRDGSRAEAEWKLFSANGALVGVFPESQSNGTWTTMGTDAIRAMARRVASRLRRNADLRRATLTSLASAPPITSIDYSAVLPSGAPSLAPMPRQRPTRSARRSLQTAALQPIAVQPVPLRPAPVQPVPQQFVVNTDAMSKAVPRRRPDGIRTAALSPTPAPLPQAIQPVAPLQPVQQVFETQPIAPLAPLAPPVAPLAAPSLAAAPPPPSFETLRAAPDGPRALVFRGVRGAPGNGDQALGREVSRLLGQSGAQLAPNGTPNALYLTADVSRTRNGGSDSIKILWHVEEEDGTRVGQVVQENDVPAGALDSSWGEDAFYAAQGARDGIMELLRTSGAIDA